MTDWWTTECGFNRALIMREAHRSARCLRRPIAERMAAMWRVAKDQRDAMQEVAAFWGRRGHDAAAVADWVKRNELNHGG